MANTYIDVPRESIEARLRAIGFQRADRQGEVTYYRDHAKNPRLKVFVFTSVPQFDTVARECGEDAIRVDAVLTWTRKGEQVVRYKALSKKRVYRVNSVEGVLDRMVEAARDAYRALNAQYVADRQEAQRTGRRY